MPYLKAVGEKLACNYIAASSAIELIASADLIHHTMTVFRSGEIDQHIPARPPIDQWDGFYRDGTDLLRGIADADKSLLGMDGDEVVETYKMLGQLSWLARRKPEDLRVVLEDLLYQQEIRRGFLRSLRLAPRAFSMFLARISRELRHRDEVASEKASDEFISTPQMLFYTRVLLPCVMHYQLTPRTVMHRAMQGDSNMIENLCRLDPWAHDLPVVSQWLNHPAGPVRTERMRKFRYLREQGINDGQFTNRRVKQCIGGFAHLMIQHTGRWLDVSVRPWVWREPKVNRGVILELFHAVEKERTGNPMAEDPDLCGPQNRSFYKQVERASLDWKPLLIHERQTKVA